MESRVSHWVTKTVYINTEGLVSKNTPTSSTPLSRTLSNQPIPHFKINPQLPTMRISPLLALFASALADSKSQTTQNIEDIWFGNSHMLLERDSETQVVAFGVTLQPSGAACDATNFTFPSPEFRCSDSGYSFSLLKFPEFYSRYSIHISHLVENGYAKTPKLPK
jgi:hypothetical protein